MTISRDDQSHVITWEDVVNVYDKMTPAPYRRLRWAPLEVMIGIALTVGTVAHVDQVLLHLEPFDAGECEPIRTRD